MGTGRKAATCEAQAAMSSTDASACRIKANGVLARDSARWTSRRRLRCRTFGLSGPGIEMPRITTPLISARLRRFHQTLPLSNPGRQRHPRLKKTAPGAPIKNKGSLVRNKPTAYGRATRGLSRSGVPFPTQSIGIVGQRRGKLAGDRCGSIGEPGSGEFVQVTFALRILAPTGPSTTSPPRFAGQAKPTPYGRG